MYLPFPVSHAFVLFPSSPPSSPLRKTRLLIVFFPYTRRSRKRLFVTLWHARRAFKNYFCSIKHVESANLMLFHTVEVSGGHNRKIEKIKKRFIANRNFPSAFVELACETSRDHGINSFQTAFVSRHIRCFSDFPAFRLTVREFFTAPNFFFFLNILLFLHRKLFVVGTQR